MRRPGGAVLVAALLAALGACSDDGPDEGEARLEVDGEAIVERADGERQTVDGSTDLREGDRVSVHEGTALMRLGEGTVFELREGLDDAADTTVLMGSRPELEQGDLLVGTQESAELEADGTRVRVTDGSARLRRALGMSVSSYDADVALDSAGVPAEVPALRRMGVPDLGKPPARAQPIDYDERDTWDRRFLGAAIALGGRLEDIAEALTGNLPPGEGRTPGFFRIMLPTLEAEPAFDADLLKDHLDREPGETLVGAAITDLGEKHDFKTRWEEVFEFRDLGADWGIVALDQAVRSEPLVGTVESALNASFEEAAFILPPSGPGPVDPPAAGPGPTDPTPPGPPGDGDPTPPPGPPPPTVPPDPPLTPDTGQVLEPVVEPVGGLLDGVVDGLLDGLLGPVLGRG